MGVMAWFVGFSRKARISDVLFNFSTEINHVPRGV